MTLWEHVEHFLYLSIYILFYNLDSLNNGRLLQMSAEILSMDAMIFVDARCASVDWEGFAWIIIFEGLVAIS